MNRTLRRCAAGAAILIAWGCRGEAPGVEPGDGAPGTTAAAREDSSSRPTEPRPDPAVACAAARPDPVSYAGILACQQVLDGLIVDEDPTAADRTLAAWEATTPGHWSTALLRGYAAERRWQAGEARELFATSLDQATAGRSALGRASARLGLGYLAEIDAQDVDAALAHYVAALAAAEEAGDDDLIELAGFAASVLYRDAGRYWDERDLLARMLDRLTGDAAAIPWLRYQLADAWRKLGDLRRARDLFEQLRSTAPDEYWQALASMGAGYVQLDRRRPGDAVERFESAAALARRSGQRELVLHAEILAAWARLRDGQIELARDLLRDMLPESRAVAEEIGGTHRVQEAINRLYLAEALTRTGDRAAAERHYHEAHRLAVELDRHDLPWQASTGLAELHLAEGRLPAALEAAGRSVAEVEGLRNAIRDSTGRTHFFRVRGHAYTLLADARLRSDPDAPGPVFDAMERAHARALRDVLADRQPADRPDARGLRDLRGRLGADDLLLEFLLGRDVSFLLAVDRDEARVYRLDARESLERDVERYLSLLLRPLTHVDARLDAEGDFARWKGEAERLRAALLGPALEWVSRKRRLWVVPDGALHRLPFAALPSPEAPGRFLGATHELVYLGAASLLPGRPLSGLDGAVVVGDERARPDLRLPALPGVPLETRLVARAHVAGRPVVLRGEAVAPGAIGDALRDRDVLHVAAHGVLDPVGGPRLLVGDATATIDVDAILEWPRAPRLVVLSACESAEGELVPGEGMLGLVRAFALAGTTGVVATRWSVDDEVAARLMGRFHERLAEGLSVGEALRAARADLLEGGFVHPFYWAPFAAWLTETAR